MGEHTSRLQNLLAQNLKTAREKLGYSQQELAERSGISPGHMNDLEQSRKWVSANTLQRLGDALGLEPFMLLLPPAYSRETDSFSLLAEYATHVKERIDGALDSSMKEILAKQHGDD